MQANSDNDFTPRRFGFLLLDNFTLISLSAAVEPLRMANRINKADHFQWLTLSQDGAPVVASDGLSINVDASMQAEGVIKSIDLLIVCGGTQVLRSSRPPLHKFLRQVAAQGVALGAICTGSHILADAGLLSGYRCSIHWENIHALNSAHPDLNVRRTLFSLDRDRYTSSGGTAPIDLMLHLISAELGPKVAAAIAEQFICDRIRRDDDEQRVPLKHLIGNQSTKLVTAVELMEANLREPISQEELADYVGLSRRQLQRLFHKYLLCAPSRYYLQLRLKRAREYLQQSRLSIMEVTAECGFVSTSHFSKSYKEYFGYSPSTERQRAADSSSDS